LQGERVFAPHAVRFAARIEFPNPTPLIGVSAVRGGPSVAFRSRPHTRVDKRLVGCGTPSGRASKSREPLLKLDQIRPNVFTLRATGQELSALVAAARMALDLMRSDPRVPAETLELLTLVLRDYDHALARHEQADGRSSRPSVDSSEDEVSPL
jgi:hypothetical protein